MDLHDTLLEIQRTAVKATAAELLLDTPRLKTYWDRAGGAAVDLPVPPLCHDHSVESIEDLLSAMEALTDTPERAAVFCGAQQIVLLLDRQDRRDRVTMALGHHDKWTMLVRTYNGADLAGLRPMADCIFPQRALVAWLRAFDDAVGPADLLVKVRSVAFERRAGAAGEVGHQRESLGRSVEASVLSSQGDVPEVFYINCPIYAGDGMRVLSAVSVKMRLDILKEQEAFVVSPMPGAIDDAEDVAATQIHLHVRSVFPEEVAVIRGVCN